MSEAIMMLFRAINTNKGQSLGVNALLLGVLKSMPAEQREKAFEEFDKEVTTLRDVIDSSGAEHEISQGLEVFIDELNQRRAELVRT